MTERLLQEERILKHLYFLRPVFTKRGFRHGLAYINGLIFSFKKSVKKITTNDRSYSHHSGIQRLLNSLKFDFEKLQQKYFSKIRWLFKGEISLIFDDSLVEREGTHVELTQSHKDHVSNGYIAGHQFFTAILVAENVVLPLFPKVFHKDSESKIEMAKNLVRSIGDKFNITNVMFDSWYSDRKLMKLSKKYAKRVICGLKANRNISVEPKIQKKIRLFVDKSKAKSYYIDECQYDVQELLAKVKSISQGKVLLSRQYFPEKMSWSNSFFLFSSDASLSVVQIMRLYQKRWKIEEFHRDIKQNLGFKPYIRKSEAIVRHAIFSTLAYAVLKMYMLYEKLDLTIGECITYLRESNYANFIKEIVEIEDKNERLAVFQEVFINKTAQV